MTELPLSPLAPEGFPQMPPVGGVRLCGVEAAITYRGRPDLMLAVLDPGTAVAGVLTRSRMPGAPVEWCRALLDDGRGRARALVVNAGNANVFTGEAGREAVRRTAAAVAALAGCDAREVMVASTGVIGEILPVERLITALPAAYERLSPEGWADAAAAIRTTDTFAKGTTRRISVAGREIVLCGIAKGSGMIAPDMATMLAFVFTDLAIEPVLLQQCLKRAADRSFNAITVDSDTSTSDTVLLFATGAAGNGALTPEELAAFEAALTDCMADLARQVVRDGEGASKFVTIRVSGAESDASARIIGKAIANSPLVKTAIAGEDANWGRIVMAIGKAGEPADRDKVSIAVGGVRVAVNGARDPDYDEADVVPHMKGREIDIAVDVGVGDGRAEVWTCDLTHGYIDINADYRS